MARNDPNLFAQALECYAELGVDVEAALTRLAALSVSLQCWQGDDVRGFEDSGAALGGGLAITGNYPGRARTADELRADLETAYALIPGRHRLNLHACYGEFQGRKIDRDAIESAHFRGWIDWARQRGLGLDFNPTCFAHPLAAAGYTLSHPDAATRQFWIEHCRRCREIGAVMGAALGTPCVSNIWIPDGSKDNPVDRSGPRARLAEALDAVFTAQFPEAQLLDAVEGKLFGIGSECYVVGSHEFYLGYAASRRKLLCLDAGHFHPTESIADKISTVLMWVPGVLLHVSRGVRWDSDHVVTLTDDLCEIAAETVRSGQMDRIHLGLDYFDASINRVTAWVIGARNFLKALLMALLEPVGRLRAAEAAGDYGTRLALREEAKSLPWPAVWDQHCERMGVPRGAKWLKQIKAYEEGVLQRRG